MFGGQHRIDEVTRAERSRLGMNEIANCGESSAEQERRLRKRLWGARTIEDPEQKTLDPAGVVRDVSEARVSKLHTRARCVCALSIQRLEGSRPRFAADAGPMQIQWWEGAASSCAEAVLQSARGECMRLEAGRMRKRVVSSVVEELEKDVRSEGRHSGPARVET